MLFVGLIAIQRLESTRDWYLSYPLLQMDLIVGALAMSNREVVIMPALFLRK